MNNFEQAVKKVLENEGGYVNDPTDAGGETKFGISKRSYPGEDTKNLTIERAKEIYKADFWDKIQGDLIMDQLIAESVFDFAVNAGVSTAVKLAQRVVEVESDGIVGKKTLFELNHVDDLYFIKIFALEKIKYYAKICEKTPTNKKYFFGWVKRAIDQVI